ncbi:MAG: TIR domain-containing protein, partial [Cyanobacteria bacterium]|nr:TIR domain-containing protein [Cyanobacteriota bacterium]
MKSPARGRSRPRAGLRVADLLLMPEEHKTLANWLIRRYEASLQEIADHVGQDPATVKQTLDALLAKGLLKTVESGGEEKYRIHLAPKSGRQMPKDIYKVLDNSSQQANVFISYSRRNKPFVERLHASLEATDREVWVDWENIPLAVDWWQEIELGIELADTFIFVISPDSVQSKVCGQEVEHAVKHNKRLVPVVHQDVSPDQVHPELARLNWIMMRADDDFEAGLHGLLQALDRNIEYVRTHTRILLRALEWDRNGRDASYLLRGKDLQQANAYLVQGRDEEPKPTPLHNQYVLASADAEADAQQAEVQRQSTVVENQRQWLRLVTAASILTIALGLTSLGLYRQTATARAAAEKARIEALSRSAEALFLSNQRFEALVAATQAGQLLQSQERTARDPQLQAAVTSALRQALFWVYERNQFTGHEGTVWQVEFSQTGDRILSVGADGTLRLWQLDGTPLQTLTVGVSLNDADLSPDGETIAAVDIQGNGYLWSRQGELLRQWSAHGDSPARVVRFAPDQGAIATGGEDGHINLWDPTTGTLIRTLAGHRGGVQALAFSADGQALLAGDERGWLYRWSTTGTLVTDVQAHRGPIQDLALKDDTLAVASHDRTVSLWRVPPGESALVSLAQFRTHAAPVNRVMFSPNGQQLITAGEDKSIRLWSRNGQPQGVLLGHTGQVTAVAVHPTANLLVSGGSDRTIRLWTLDRPHITPLPGHEAPVEQVAVSPKDDLIATVSGDRTLRLWRQDGTPLQILRAGDAPLLSVAFHPDGQRVAAASADGNLYLWSVDGATPPQIIAAHRSPAYDLAFSPDGRYLASAGDDRQVVVWTLTGDRVLTLPEYRDGVLSLAFSPDGQTLATGGEDYRIQLWDRQGQALKTLAGHQGAITDLAFSPDGQVLASASADNTARLWSLPQGDQVATLAGHQDGVRAVAFNPQGGEVATASSDNTLRFWQLDGTPLSTLSGHEASVNGIAYTANGDHIVSVSSDRTALLWHLGDLRSLEALLAASCQWLQDYLHSNPTLPAEWRHICDTVAPQPHGPEA